jgi:RimJ/RimL family protein N-acetyltransferase
MCSALRTPVAAQMHGRGRSVVGMRCGAALCPALVRREQTMIELNPEDFAALRPALLRIPINRLFARSVLEGHVDGCVWADRPNEPRLVHIIHPYGMSLLFGDLACVARAALRAHLLQVRRRRGDLWLQPAPGVSADVLDELLEAETSERPPGGPRVQRYTRSNFRYDAEHGAERRTRRGRPGPICLRRLRADEFALPDISVSPHMFWRDFDQFVAHGGGWAIEYDGELVSMAFASFRFDLQLEIGVETRCAHRGRGYARLAAGATVDQCVADGLEPVWSCRRQNTGSYQLARSLGFEPTLELPYYRLPAVASA